MWSERRAETQFDAGEGEQLRPKLAGEHRISVAHNGAREAVKPDDLVEEDPGDGHGGVGVADHDEVHVLGEPVDDGEDDQFPANVRETLDEVHGYIRPHRARNVEGLQKSGRVQVFRLVALGGRGA